MSLSEKLAAIMERPGQDPQPKDDVPWWMRYGGRGLGTVGGFFTIFVGVFNIVWILGGFNCILSGAWMIATGFLVMAVEAPCCCMFIEFIQQFSGMVESRPYWNRALVYCLLSVPPVFMCFGPSTLFANALVFGTGVIYGMMSVGKKASRAEMAQAANIDTQGVSSKPRSNLVENAVPIGFSASPKPDSNV